MVACSSRRKTKHPFCSHDPKCYWNNKSCKKRPGANNNTRRNTNAIRNRFHQDPNSKLNMILHKLNNLEAKLDKMTRKNTNNSPKPKPKPVRTSNANAVIHKKDANRNANRNSNNNGSTKTASPTNVKLLLGESRNNSAETVSPSAVNRLKELTN